MSRTKFITTSMRFSAFHLKGIEMVIKEQKKRGLNFGTRTSVVMDGLMRLFDEYEITAEDIHAEVMRETES